MKAKIKLPLEKELKFDEDEIFNNCLRLIKERVVLIKFLDNGKTDDIILQFLDQCESFIKTAKKIKERRIKNESKNKTNTIKNTVSYLNQ